jgi:hypothetical protein
MTAECHSMIADILHRHGVVDGEGFSLAAARRLERSSRWSKSEIVKVLGSISTSIFRRHPEPPKKVLLDQIGDELLERWPSSPFQSSSRQMEKIKILFLSANPVKVLAVDPVSKRPLVDMPLRLDDEVRAIQKQIRATDHRDSLDFVVRPAVRASDLLQVFNEVRPDIVHFSGHGSDGAELILVDDNGKEQPVSKAVIEALFQTMKENIRVVVLNACSSKPQATAIVKHVDCAIGMSRPIGDNAAILFAAAFYSAIGFGKSVHQAFDQGILAMKIAKNPEHSTPKLLSRKGVDPASVRILARI